MTAGTGAERSRVEAHIQKLVDAAPPLTEDQKRRLHAVLAPVVAEVARRRAAGSQP